MAKIKPKLPYGLSKMYEASLRDIINDSKRTDPQRIIKASGLTSTYLGLADSGEFEFRTNSETTPGKEWTQKIYWSNIHQYEELYTNGGHITEKDIETLLRENIRVTCDDLSFLYWSWAYKSWMLKYGLTPETREPKRNNVKLHGGACKHILSVLDLVDSSSEIRRAMAADLDVWLSDVYGVEPSEELYSDRTKLDDKPSIDDNTVSQKDIEKAVDDDNQQTVEDITQFFIDILDGYADMDYDMIEYYNGLDSEERNTLRENILSYIDEQDIDINNDNVLQILDLLD